MIYCAPLYLTIRAKKSVVLCGLPSFFNSSEDFSFFEKLSIPLGTMAILLLQLRISLYWVTFSGVIAISFFALLRILLPIIIS